jgi:F1F0 ATPase subunit 2
MDGQRMNFSFVLLHLMAGIATGTLYFASLWWSAALLEQAGRMRLLIAAMVARFLLLGGVLTAVSFEGAMPLLATAGGVLIARAVVMRRARMSAP